MMKLGFAGALALSVFAAFSMGCAHPQTTQVTSTAAAVPAAVPAAPPVAEAEEEDETEVETAKPEAKPKDAMSFAALSAALGNEKIAIDMNHTTEAPSGKGLSADGYTAVGAAHQAVTSSSGHAGDIKVGAGLSAAAVRSGVRDGAGRLRACYEHGLAANPHLAGRVMVSFSVDERGGVSGVDTQSDAIPADVMSCVRSAFEAMTFTPPKTAPTKVVYPVDFNKDS